MMMMVVVGGGGSDLTLESVEGRGNQLTDRVDDLQCVILLGYRLQFILPSFIGARGLPSQV